MKEIMDKEQAHILLLYLLQQFEKVCSEADIYYYASGGTGLGAVRHQGFIPWDDDIDVMMPREFYDRFVSAANKVLKKPVVIRTRENDPYFCQEYIKLCFLDDEIGWSDVSIDVFFLDYTKPERKLFRKTQNSLLKYLYFIKSYKITKDGHGGEYHPQGIMKRFAFSVADALLSYRFIDKIHKKIMMAESGPTEEYVNWGSCYSYKKATYSKKNLGTPHRVKFENTTILLAEHHEEILKQLYGENYMMPPKKIVDHGVRPLHCQQLDFGQVEREVGLEE